MPRFNAENYVDVQDRITRFWVEYPAGAIRTYLESPGSQFEAVVYKATIFKDCGNAEPDATGYAAEERGTDARAGANFTSWHENAETSAIGRALANMGYATTRDDRPSRQEMSKVARHQNAPVTHQNRHHAPEPPEEVAQDEMDLGETVVAMFLTNIEHAKTEKELDAIGREIKRSRLGQLERESLRDPFTRKLMAFQSTT